MLTSIEKYPTLKKIISMKYFSFGYIFPKQTIIILIIIMMRLNL